MFHLIRELVTAISSFTLSFHAFIELISVLSLLWPHIL